MYWFITGGLVIAILILKALGVSFDGGSSSSVFSTPKPKKNTTPTGKEISTKPKVQTTAAIMDAKVQTAIFEIDKFRDSDNWGSGKYGAARGTGRRHKGVDIVIPTVKLLPQVETVRVGRSYADSKEDDLIVVKPTEGILKDHEVKLMHLKPVPTIARKLKYKGDKLNRQTIIASQESLQKRFPSIKDHVHVEVRDPQGTIIDPTPYIRTREQFRAQFKK